MENDKLRYSVSGKSAFAKLSAAFMGLSILFRLLGYWGFWTNDDKGFVYLQVVLPVVSALLFLLIVLYLGKKAFVLSFIPVIFGVVFFIVKALGDGGGILHAVMCILVSLLAAMLYTGTVFGTVRTKWLLLPMFALPLAYHIIFIDMNTFLANEKAMSLTEWLPEISVLCILLSLLFVVFAMKKRDFSVPADEPAKPEEQEIIDILLENEEPVKGPGQGETNEQADGHDKQSR